MRVAVALSFTALLSGSACGSKSGPAPVEPAKPSSPNVVANAANPPPAVGADAPADAGIEPSEPAAVAPQADAAPTGGAEAPVQPTASDDVAAAAATPDAEGQPVPPEAPAEAEKEFVEAWKLVAAAAVPPLEETTGACIPGVDVEGGGSFFAPALDGRKLELCVLDFGSGDGKIGARCWSLDLDTRALDPLKTAPKRLAALLDPEPKPRTSANSKVGKGGKIVEARIGKGGDSKAPFKRLDVGGMAADAVAESADFYAVSPVFDGSAETEGKRVIVFSRSTGDKLSELSLDALGSPCPIVSFAGAMLYIEAGVCAGPGAMGYFLDPKTGAIAHRLGGLENSASAYGVVPVKLDDGDYAFREQYGLGVFVHDGKTGAHKKTLNLSSTLKKSEDGAVYGAPEGGAMLALGSPIESLVVVQLGRVALVDPKTWTVTRLIELDACPADPAP